MLTLARSGAQLAFRLSARVRACVRACPLLPARFLVGGRDSESRKENSNSINAICARILYESFGASYERSCRRSIV